MFTGIVEEMGTVRRLRSRGRGKDVTVAARKVTRGLAKGSSVCVGGACMTVVRRTRTTFDFHAMNETLLRTAFRGLAVGGRVNLERSLRASDRMDGHIVQGHVDGVGVVTRIDPEGTSVRVWIRAPRSLRRYIAEKGSIAVDGVSLTVAGLRGAEFAAALIPHTLAITTLGLLRKGSRVNLEIDVLARYLERLLSERPVRARAGARRRRAA